MTRYELDVAKLIRVLDEQRKRSRVSWRQFATLVGVDHVVFHRMRQGKNPSSNQLLTILVHLGADYLPITRPTGKGKPE